MLRWGRRALAPLELPSCMIKKLLVDSFSSLFNFYLGFDFCQNNFSNSIHLVLAFKSFFVHSKFKNNSKTNSLNCLYFYTLSPSFKVCCCVVLVLLDLRGCFHKNMSIYYFYCRKFMFFRFRRMKRYVASHVREAENKTFFPSSFLSQRRQQQKWRFVHFVIINYLECERFLSNASTVGKSFRDHKRERKHKFSVWSHEVAWYRRYISNFKNTFYRGGVNYWKAQVERFFNVCVHVPADVEVYFTTTLQQHHFLALVKSSVNLKPFLYYSMLFYGFNQQTLSMINVSISAYWHPF